MTLEAQYPAVSLSKGDETISFRRRGLTRRRRHRSAAQLTLQQGQGSHNGRSKGHPCLAKDLPQPQQRPVTRVVLFATTAEGGTTAVEVTVAGIFATITKAYDDSVPVRTDATVRQLMRVEGDQPG